MKLELFPADGPATTEAGFAVRAVASGLSKVPVLWRKRHKKNERPGIRPHQRRRQCRAEILSKQALNTLTPLHSELAGKIEGNRKTGDKLRAQMVQVEAVMKMLDPDFNARAISAKRRNTGNPWFKRGTLYRGAVDVLRRSGEPHDGG
jgi:hypothetical protein